MKPVVGFLRSIGILSVIYLDDLLLLGNTYSECLKNVNTASDLLERLGFTINEEKSCKIPSQSCKFLGFILNSRKMLLELPPERRYKTLDQIRDVKNLKQCKIRDLAQLIGTLVSCCPAIKYSWAHIKDLERKKILSSPKIGWQLQRGHTTESRVTRGFCLVGIKRPTESLKYR